MNNELNNEQSIETAELDNEIGGESETTGLNPKKPWWKRVNLKTGIIIAVVVIACGALYYFKNVFVVASVDGKLISRYSVIKSIESAYGQQALENLITEKLIKMGLSKSNIVISDDEINGEISILTANLANQGSTLALALEQSNMTESDLRDKISTQKKLEKILADKTAVTSEEVDKYIKDNKITFKKGDNVDEQKAQISESLKQQKFNQEAGIWLENLRSQAKIKYFLNY
jgi:hypothetical protein